MRSLFPACAIALIVAAVPGCGRAALAGAARSPGVHRSRAAGPLAAASPFATGPGRRPADSATGRCHASGLGVRFQGGGYGGGNDFASIYIWNPGPVPCQLAGAVTFTAFFAGGATDQNARTTLQHLAVTLPARMTRPGEGADPSRSLTAYQMGPERQDPAQPNGL